MADSSERFWLSYTLRRNGLHPQTHARAAATQVLLWDCDMKPCPLSLSWRKERTYPLLTHHFLHLLLFLHHCHMSLSVLLKTPLQTLLWQPPGGLDSLSEFRVDRYHHLMVTAGTPIPLFPPFASPGCQVLGLNVIHCLFGSHYQHGGDLKEGGMGWVLLSLSPPAFLSSLFYRTPALEPQGETSWQIK